jgi:large subunit ribosomal protein L25
MKTRIELTVEPRETGKGNSRHLRVNKKIPAVVYGAIENTNLFVNENDVVKYNTRKFENSLFTLKSSNTKANGKVVLMKSVDVHPLSRQPLHVDFFALDMNKTVRVFIEVKLEGKPLGIADGGLLNVVNRQIEVEVLPADIPESISADISHLGVGDALHVSDLTLPPKLKVISAPELTVAVVNLQEEEVVETPVAAATAAPAAGAAAAPAAAGAAAPAAGAKDAKAAPAKDAKAAPAKK